MKALELEQMESIIDGDFNVGGASCGAGFTGYGTLIRWGLAAAASAASAGTIALVGLRIGLIGAGVCSLSLK